MDGITVTWQELKQLSDKHFGWHSTHFSRKWEYPWVCSRLAELDISGKAILDAGTGMSPVVLWAANQGARAITVDSGGQGGKGAGFVDYSRCISTITSYRNDFAKMDFLAGNSLDALISISVIEHVSADKRLQAFAEWYRVLRPGGYLILTVDLIGPSDRLLNKRDGKRIESNKSHGDLSVLRHNLFYVGFLESAIVICPLKRRLSIRERTTHVMGMVLRKNENES